jgi:predicted nucleic acid-binding protein
MNSVFLDTDVILDLYISREPHHSIALRLFSRLKKTKIRCFTSAVGIANTYYILAKIEGGRFAIDKLRKLRKLLSIAPLNEAIIDSALSIPHKDFEDSIQINCAIQNGINILITRNTKDYPKGQVKVTDPLQYLSAAMIQDQS